MRDRLQEGLTTSHLFRGFGYSEKAGRILARALLILIFVSFGLVRLRFTLEALESPAVYRKDFLQEYMLARALIDGANPYLPVTTLAKAFIKDLSVPVFPHPTPHPPPVALFALPLGLLNYETAAQVWFVVELVCLAGAVWVLFAIARVRPSPGALVLLTIATVMVAPVWTDLVLGQLMIILLLLLASCWRAIEKGKDWLAGILLGVALALKLMGLPILLFLSLRRKWAPVGAAIGVAGIANVVAGLFMGFGPVVAYYTDVSRLMFSLYRSAPANISTWTIGWRLFDGTGSPVLFALQAPPLFHSPFLAAAVSPIVPFAVLAVGMVLALRACQEDIAFGMLVCVTILFHPVAWNHYLVLMAVPLVIALRRVSERKFPGRDCIFLLCIVVLLGIPVDQLEKIQAAFGVKLLPDQEVLVPFPVTLLSLAYTAAVIGMLWFLWRLEPTGAANTENLDG